MSTRWGCSSCIHENANDNDAYNYYNDQYFLKVGKINSVCRNICIDYQVYVVGTILYIYQGKSVL